MMVVSTHGCLLIGVDEKYDAMRSVQGRLRGSHGSASRRPPARL